ncbi:MAG: formylglycine-generating enzyme family protein, partial [bacterium]
DPTGANCLGECGPSLSVDHGVNLRRGTGHTMAGNSKAGVNGLYEMGANVWEWIQGEGPQARTRGGSWWYGARPMHREHSAYKPKDFYAIYIGFRCASDL